MTALILWTVVLAAPAPNVEAPAKEATAKKELFAKEAWYKDQKGDETGFTGVLKFTPRGKGVVGFGRHNPYRLDFPNDKGAREVYVGGQVDVLKEFAGKTVKITGKAVDMSVEGRDHREIWPARIEVIPDAAPKVELKLQFKQLEVRPRLVPETLPVVPEKRDPSAPIKID